MFHNTQPNTLLKKLKVKFNCDLLWFPHNQNEVCSLVFSKWRDRWIRRIGQNHPCMNKIQLQPHTSTEKKHSSVMVRVADS